MISILLFLFSMGLTALGSNTTDIILGSTAKIVVSSEGLDIQMHTGGSISLQGLKINGNVSITKSSHQEDQNSLKLTHVSSGTVIDLNQMTKKKIENNDLRYPIQRGLHGIFGDIKNHTDRALNISPMIAMMYHAGWHWGTYTIRDGVTLAKTTVIYPMSEVNLEHDACTLDCLVSSEIISNASQTIGYQWSKIFEIKDAAIDSDMPPHYLYLKLEPTLFGLKVNASLSTEDSKKLLSFDQKEYPDWECGSFILDKEEDSLAFFDKEFAERIFPFALSIDFSEKSSNLKKTTIKIIDKL